MIARGQRWTSDAEPELGLGIVVDVDGRSVTLEFRAADVTRRYAVRSAPLRRVRFAPGDRVASDDGASFEVESVEEQDGLLVYRGAGRDVGEDRISADVALGGPRERLLAGQADPPALFDLRVETARRLHGVRSSVARGLLGSRIELLPHQFYVAAEATSRRTPRVLLADETGLGKTIEACLTVNRLLLTGRASRVLVLVPGSLVHQWLVELRRRFNLAFAIFDEERCEAIDESQPDENPFATEQLVLAATDLLAADERRARQAGEAGWDVVVVDEAHHLRWTPQAASAEYRAVEEVARGSEGLLLLTATPEQLGEEGHFARLRLLDPDRYSDFASWRQEADGYREAARVARALLDGADDRDAEPRAIGEADANALAAVLETDAASVRSRAADVDGRRRLLDELIDRHGPGRVMFRNTRSVLVGFPERRVELHELPASPPAATGARDRGGSLDLVADGRVDWLVERLGSRDGPDKLLVICRSAETSIALKAAIEHRIRVDVALFHEGLTLVQRDRNAAWFAAADGARVLVCSEIGSEGRNFQHAQDLVMFDLPLDPDLVEQRIGRLDRIGQSATVHVHVPIVSGTGMEVLARWHRDGVGSFERGSQVGQALFERFGATVDALARAAAGGGFDEGALGAVIAETAATREELSERVERGRDRLLEIASLRGDVAERLITEVEASDADVAVEDLFVRLLEHFRVYAEEIGPRTYLLDPDAMHGTELPSLDSGRAAVTFDRHTALVREDLGFVTRDHPLLGDAMELLLAAGAGNAAFGVDTSAGSPGIVLEAMFVLESVAPPRLHVDRFLPPTPLHVATDSRLGDLTDDLEGERVALSPGQGGWIAEQQAALRPALSKMLDRCEALATRQASRVRAAAKAALRETLQGELDRLRALARVNDAVRPEEISLVQHELAELERHIASARLRLDALRLVWRGPAQDGVPATG